MCALTAPQCAFIDLYGGETVTAEVELSLHFETGRVPLQDGPITAAGECLLTERRFERSFHLKRLVKHVYIVATLNLLN